MKRTRVVKMLRPRGFCKIELSGCLGNDGQLGVSRGRILPVYVQAILFSVREGALRTAGVLEQLRAESELDWVFLSPAAVIAPGARTGKYRIGGDQLLTDGNGESRISVEDYAVAMLDEAESASTRVRAFRSLTNSVAY